jgi:hypothetical protein
VSLFFKAASDVKRKARISRFRNKIEQVNQLMKQFEQMSNDENDARTRRKTS